MLSKVKHQLLHQLLHQPLSFCNLFQETHVRHPSDRVWSSSAWKAAHNCADEPSSRLIPSIILHFVRIKSTKSGNKWRDQYRSKWPMAMRNFDQLPMTHKVDRRLIHLSANRVWSVVHWNYIHVFVKNSRAALAFAEVRVWCGRRFN